jgi:hypothetical protein
MYSGEDFTKLIRIHAQLQNYFANHVYRIFKDKTIINTINPSGLVIKNDLTLMS